MRRSAMLITALVAALSAPAAAQADVWGSECPAAASGQYFAQFGDPSTYVLAPGGDAESAAGLTLTGGADVQPGNESYSVLGSGSNHVQIPAGGSATTGAACIGLDSPDLRMFTRSSGTLPSSRLRVEVIADTDSGTVTIPVGMVAPGSQWTPSAPYLMIANVFSLRTRSATSASIRLTPMGPGNWSVDDVLIDPWRGGG